VREAYVRVAPFRAKPKWSFGTTVSLVAAALSSVRGVFGQEIDPVKQAVSTWIPVSMSLMLVAGVCTYFYWRTSLSMA